jgi:hypothetical protein
MREWQQLLLLFVRQPSGTLMMTPKTPMKQFCGLVEIGPKGK